MNPANEADDAVGEITDECPFPVQKTVRVEMQIARLGSPWSTVGAVAAIAGSTSRLTSAGHRSKL